MDTATRQSEVAATELKAVLVTWLDAVAYADWHTPSADAAMCATLGFLVSTTDTAIEVASSVGLGDDVCNASIVIPRGMIVSIDDVALPTKGLH